VLLDYLGDGLAFNKLLLPGKGNDQRLAVGG
jgi:hypothetical protein